MKKYMCCCSGCKEVWFTNSLTLALAFVAIHVGMGHKAHFYTNEE